MDVELVCDQKKCEFLQLTAAAVLKKWRTSIISVFARFQQLLPLCKNEIYSDYIISLKLLDLEEQLFWENYMI